MQHTANIQDTAEIFSAGRLALVTGAASGIGLAACRFLAGRGMVTVMCDSDGAALAAARKALVAGDLPDARLVAREIDVADRAAMAALRDELLADFSAPAFVMNNAASRTGGGIDAPRDDWRRAMEVNFWGVVNGVDAFLPAMVGAGDPAMIVNTGSKQGITNPPGNLAYNITKSALKTYTEGLQHDLRNRAHCRVSAHLLIPGWTTTGGRDHQPGAWMPEQVVDAMQRGLARGDFYILCQDNEVTREMDAARIAWGAGDIIENRPPLSRWHPGFKGRVE